MPDRAATQRKGNDPEGSGSPASVRGGALEPEVREMDSGGGVPSGGVDLRALEGIGSVSPGDDLSEIIWEALGHNDIRLAPCDVLVVASKIVSRAEGRFVDLSGVDPGPEARALAERVDRDPRLVELVLRESEGVSRARRGALIVRHRLGFVSANAGVDASNVGRDDAVLLLPEDPDGSAARLRNFLETRAGVSVGVVVSDSHGRPFRLGSVGMALGLSGLPALWDQRGGLDRFGRPMQHTITALADQVAAAADLVAGQGGEGTPVVLVRGLVFQPCRSRAVDLLRRADEDLYA